MRAVSFARDFDAKQLKVGVLMRNEATSSFYCAPGFSWLPSAANHGHFGGGDDCALDSIQLFPCKFPAQARLLRQNCVGVADLRGDQG
jgi:hypothetical protein